jgi:ATP-dependent HslUV protease subunit HslV
VYDQISSAREIALVGAEAGAEFDKSSSGPFRIFSFPMH